jgi:hypothetical protein
MIEVLTHKGFKSFDGILDKGISDHLLEITFSNNKNIKCTPDHELLMSDGETYIPAIFLQVDDCLYPEVFIKSINQIENENVYDLLNVEDTNAYYTNGIVSHNCIFMDEFAFVQNANEFYTSTYPVISSGKETKVIITSTPNGVGNMFYKLWEGSIQKSNEFKGFRIRWEDVPGRDEEWKRQTIANTSELQFDQEYSCSFIGSSQTLVSSESLLGLSAIEPLKRQHGINYYYEPEEGHDYIMTVDVSKGRGQDYSTFSVIDISSMPFKVVCTYRDNMVSPLIFPEYIMRGAKQYNEALVVIENNDAGMVVCNAIYYDYEYDNTFVQSSTKSNGIGVTMSKRVKRIGCSNLKDLLESGKLQICDAHTIQELSSFEPKGDSYAASGSTHDDMVMNLVMFAWFVSTDAFGGMSNVDLKELLYSDKIKEMEEDLPPFGIINNGNNSTSNFESFNKYQETIDSMQEWGNL